MDSPDIGLLIAATLALGLGLLVPIAVIIGVAVAVFRGGQRAPAVVVVQATAPKTEQAKREAVPDPRQQYSFAMVTIDPVTHQPVHATPCDVQAGEAAETAAVIRVQPYCIMPMDKVPPNVPMSPELVQISDWDARDRTWYGAGPLPEVVMDDIGAHHDRAERVAKRDAGVALRRAASRSGAGQKPGS